MIFEYTTGLGKPSLLEELSTFLGSPCINNSINLREKLGHGLIKGYKLGNSLRLMTHKTILKEDLVFRRVADRLEDHDIAITFHWYLKRPGEEHRLAGPKPSYDAPYVQITSSNIDYQTVFKSDCVNRAVIIVLHPKELSSWLGRASDSQQIQHLLPENAIYYYDEVLTSKMQEVATELIDVEEPTEINNLLLEVKSKELIYLVLSSLLKRRDQRAYPINGSDVKSVYVVRDKIMADLTVRPNVGELAKLANMSGTKLSRLFRQIFGYSIYDYYLAMKVREAADLIRQKKFSVSEAGYRVGFTNLSHFSRIFERHVGMKPKKYSMTAG
jgi:AraC-like DNA-binding protein